MDNQWEKEIRTFIKRLYDHDVDVCNGDIYAVYDKRIADNRFIIWEKGSTRLRDDSYCMQHSRELTNSELGKIYKFIAEY